jgi:lysophospholipase L1-like esterase
MRVKTILCYGDSNTWGWDPATTERYPADMRWTGVLAATLGGGWSVIPEGLNGRTTVLDDPIEDFKNGRAQLVPCLESHKPIDLVILMLGTNDLKTRFNFGAYDIAEAVGSLVDIIKASDWGIDASGPRILVLAPPPILEVSPYLEMFRGGREKSLQFKSEFGRMSAERGVPAIFVDDLTSLSPIDGIHLSQDGHRAIGLAVARKAKAILE